MVARSTLSGREFPAQYAREDFTPEIRMRAERRLGQLVVAQKETLGLSQGKAG